MISVTELRAGRTFKFEGEPYIVVEYKHTKLGRGNANIRLKVRHLRTGNVLEKTFVSGSKVEEAETQLRTMQYLYQDGENFYFMDPRSFGQFPLPGMLIGDKARFVKEGAEVKILFLEDQPLSVELPNWLVFKVVQAPPGVKGDTVSASLKPVTLDNGLVIKAPLFIKIGDKIKVSTKTGTYLERVK